jgi:HEAT repeat protein
MTERPSADQPDAIWIGPVGPIPVFHDDDPRLEADKVAGRRFAAVADGMHSAEELLAGLHHPEAEVRWRVVDRLVARAGSDARTVPVMLDVLRSDPSWKVRDAIAMAFSGFHDQRVVLALHQALTDDHEEVRWAARYALTQLGERP